MGHFRRVTKKQPVDLSALLLQGEDMNQQLGNAHHTRWGLGTADRWGLDQTTGLITWTFPNKMAVAPAQILGSHSASAGTWLWAWANEGLQPGVRGDAERVRRWADENQVTAFQAGQVKADAEQAATMVPSPCGLPMPAGSIGLRVEHPLCSSRSAR